MAFAADHSKAVILLLFIQISLLMHLRMGFCVGSLFCGVVLSSLTIILLSKREVFALF